MKKRERVYSEEQIKILEQNPYTHSVTPYTLVLTLEFKQFFMSKVNEPGMTCPKILRAAGYDTTFLKRSYFDSLRKKILTEAASSEGLKPPRGLSQTEKIRAFAKKDLERQKASTSIRELQDRVVHLEQQIEFLKKISSTLHPPENQ